MANFFPLLPIASRRTTFIRVFFIPLKHNCTFSLLKTKICHNQLIVTIPSARLFSNNTRAVIEKTRAVSGKSVEELSKEGNYFEKSLQSEATKESFLAALDSFKEDDKYRRKHLKFIRVAMEYLETFGLQENVDAYNAIMDIFPRNRFNTKRFFDTIWAKPHPQAFLALELLTKMEENGVRPTYYTYELCLEIFGKGSLPVRKCCRLAYWLAVFENINPYKLPESVYKESINVCKAALQRIHLGDEGKVSTYVLEQMEGSEEKKFIVGSVMKYQENALEKLHTDVPLFVEGPINMWINRAQEDYYVLRTDHSHSLQPFDDDFNKYYWQDYTEGIVIAMCMTNKKVPEALLEWIEALEKEISRLKDFKIVFNLTCDGEDSDVIHNLETLEPRREAPRLS